MHITENKESGKGFPRGGKVCAKALGQGKAWQRVLVSLTSTQNWSWVKAENVGIRRAGEGYMAQPTGLRESAHTHTHKGHQ